MWRFLLRFLSPLVAFHAFWGAPGSILEGSKTFQGGFWRLQKLIFQCFFRLSRARAPAVRQSSRCAKTIIFPRFQARRKCCAQDKKRDNIAPGACRTKLSTKIVFKTRLGACRALFGRNLGQSWMPLGRLLAGFWLLVGGF